MPLLSKFRLHVPLLHQPIPVYWREAFLCFPAIPLILAVGISTDRLAPSIVAAGAAYSAGFGAARDLRGRRWGAMSAATVGMSAAAFIGSLTGQQFPIFLLLSCAAAAGTAALALSHDDLWWVALQILIALFVAGSFPGPLPKAMDRAAAVLAGGVVQMLVVVVFAKIFPAAGAPLPVGQPLPPPTRRTRVSHILRAAICVLIAFISARAFGLANSYWAPMTGMLILKPGLHETRARGFSRVTGTIAGGATASIFAVVVHYSPSLLIVGVALTATLSFALQKANYAVLTCAITATVVLLLSLASGPALVNAEHRLIATLLGGGVALLVAWVAPHRLIMNGTNPDQVGFYSSTGTWRTTGEVAE